MTHLFKVSYSSHHLISLNRNNGVNVRLTEKDQVPCLEARQPSATEKAQKMTFMEVLLQDSVDAKQPSTIYLINGIKLEGFVMAFDHESIVYQRDLHSKPFGVNRSAVASFLPEGASLSRYNADPEQHRGHVGSAKTSHPKF
jgi:sRNA-binding regulator protein Hfq